MIIVFWFQISIVSELELDYSLEKKKRMNDYDKNGGYANSSVELAPGIFLSYFPSSKFTTLVLHNMLLSKLTIIFTKLYCSRLRCKISIVRKFKY
jgi:hypothetical protein